MLDANTRIAFLDLDNTILFDNERSYAGYGDETLELGVARSERVMADEQFGKYLYASDKVISAMQCLKEECIIIVSTARRFDAASRVACVTDYADALCCLSGSEFYIPARSFGDREPGNRWVRSREYDAWVAREGLASSPLVRRKLCKALQKMLKNVENWFLLESEYSMSIARGVPSKKDEWMMIQSEDEWVLSQSKELEVSVREYGISVVYNDGYIEFADCKLSKASPFDFLYLPRADKIFMPGLESGMKWPEVYVMGDDVNDLVHARKGRNHSAEVADSLTLKGFYYPKGSILDKKIGSGEIDISACRNKFIRGRYGVEFFPNAVDHLLTDLK